MSDYSRLFSMITTKEDDLKKVRSLKTNEKAYIFWSEGGGGIVERHPYSYNLFSVSQYGGEPVLEGLFHIGQEQMMVDLAWTWT